MSSWFSGFCCLCNYQIVVTQPIVKDDPYADYLWYCSNKECKNHSGEHTGDMDFPDFYIKKPFGGDMKHILIAEDNHEVTRFLQEYIKRYGHEYELTIVRDAIRAIERFAEKKYDFIITDYNMPPYKENGIDFIKKIRETDKEVPVLLYTGECSFDAPKDLEFNLCSKDNLEYLREFIKENIQRQE